jgi:hypothetical protein
MNDPSIQHYPFTVLHFPGVVVDLTASVPPEAADILTNEWNPLAVISGCNPFGEILSEADNSERSRRLQARLEQRASSIL